MSKSGSSGRTRINIQTYFQQHAGRRMTPKTVESSRNQINRAQIERISTTSVMYISSQNDKRNLIRRRLPWTSDAVTGTIKVSTRQPPLSCMLPPEARPPFLEREHMGPAAPRPWRCEVPPLAFMHGFEGIPVPVKNIGGVVSRIVFHSGPR